MVMLNVLDIALQGLLLKFVSKIFTDVNLSWLSK